VAHNIILPSALNTMQLKIYLIAALLSCFNILVLTDKPLPYEFSCKNVGKNDGFCERKTARNCPFFPKRYWCGEETTHNILSKMKLEHPKSKLFTKPYIQHWSKLLQKRGNILFTGDSVHSHAAFSLMCSMRDYSDKRKYSFARLFPYSKRVSKLFSKISRKYFCTKTLNKELICYDRTNVAQDILSKYAFYKRFFSEFGVVVMNYGLHNKELNTDPIKELVHRLSTDLIGTNTILIWRETAPQHFSNLGGVFSADKLSAACSDISKDPLVVSNQFNLKYNPIFEKYNIRILRVWNLTRNYYDAHIHGECTHYCQPGVADLWVEKLYHMLDSDVLENTPSNDIGLPAARG